MSQASEYRFDPDYTVAPGETLRERLTEINLSQAELASRSGLSTKHINQIVQGVAPISHETALILERVTGLPAGLVNRLEAGYREALLRARHRELTAKDEEWVSLFPVKELQDRGLLARTRDMAALLDGLLAYFGVADREAWERVWMGPVASFKRSKAFRSDPGSVAAWLRIGELGVRGRTTAPYEPARFRDALSRARALTRLDSFSDELVELCAEAGVAVVFVPEVGRCRVSGSAWWATPTRAVIQLSDRYKGEDSFWFAFFHEAAHILLHSKKETFIDDESGDDQLESEANQFAANTLIPPAAAAGLKGLASDTDVELFAAEVGVSPGIVVGRLHNDGVWGWNKGNRLRRRIRIVES